MTSAALPHWDPPPAYARLCALWTAWCELRRETAYWQASTYTLPKATFEPVELSRLRQRLAATFAAERSNLRHELEHCASLPGLAETRSLLQTIPGLGPLTALALLVRADQLYNFNPRQLTAYLGLAPVGGPPPLSRGDNPHHRGGDVELRHLLVFAAWAAQRRIPRLADFSHRLSLTGKPRLVVRLAVARKLLLIAQAVLLSGAPYRELPLPDPGQPET